MVYGNARGQWLVVTGILIMLGSLRTVYRRLVSLLATLRCVMKNFRDRLAAVPHLYRRSGRSFLFVGGGMGGSTAWRYSFRPAARRAGLWYAIAAFLGGALGRGDAK